MKKKFFAIAMAAVIGLGGLSVLPVSALASTPDVPLHSRHVVFRPLFVDSATGEQIEGNTCVSVSGHGAVNHKPVHLYHNTENKTYVVDDYGMGKYGHEAYGFKDGPTNNTFKAWELSNKTGGAGTILRGHSKFSMGNTHMRFEVSFVDLWKPELKSNKYVVQILAESSGLPVGLEKQNDDTDHNKLQVHRAEDAPLWVMEITD